MYCKKCGAILAENDNFCVSCGTGIEYKSYESNPGTFAGAIGFSGKINDPTFAKYIKNNNRWSVIFSVILAVAAIIGFFIYGETSSEMENPQALFIGIGIGSMSVTTSVYQDRAKENQSFKYYV